MNKELQTIDFDNFEDVAKLTGQQNFDSEGSLAFLKINAMPQDKAGNRLIAGSFEVKLPGHGFVYATEIKFRPFIRAMQYRRFSQKENKVISETKICLNWNEEFYDTTGTIRCGRPRLKKGEQATPSQQAVIDETPCYMIFYGLVTITDPVDVTGDKVVGTHTVPCVFRTRGVNYKAMSDVVDLLTARRRDMIRTEIKLGLKMQVNGAVVYYEIVPTVDFTGPLVWDAANDPEGMKVFLNHMQDTNKRIHEAYVNTLNGIKANKTRTIEAEEVVEMVDDLADLPQDDSHTEAFTKVKNSKPRNRVMAG